MPGWMQDWPVLGVFLFFLFGAVARSQAIYWIGRGVVAGVLRSRWGERLDAPQVRRATATFERWGMPVIPLAFLTVGFQSAVFASVGLLRVHWLRYTLWTIPGCLVWAALWGGSGLAVVAAGVALARRSPLALAATTSSAGRSRISPTRPGTTGRRGGDAHSGRPGPVRRAQPACETQNWLPSGSDSTTQVKPGVSCRATSKAPSVSRRCTSRSRSGADTSTCRRFLPGVGSVTCWKPSVVPPSAPASTMMNSSPRLPTTLPPVCRDHQSARA